MSKLSTKPKHARYREQRRAAGLCVRCGKVKTGDGTSCDLCRIKRKSKRVIRYQQIKAETGIHPDTLRRRQIREAVIRHYGGCCITCGVTELPFLNIDHIDGGGRQHRKAIGPHLTAWLVRSGFPPGFQILCWNCNHLKHLAVVRANLLQTKEARGSRISVVRLKMDILLAYGGYRCVCCNIENPDLLTLDHIDGGGHQHKKSVGCNRAIYRQLKTQGYPAGYQVLCFNCNCGRQVNGGVCPHKSP